MREFEIYNAYYCAICHSIRDRYGQAPRLLLSWDAVFLAMMLASMSDKAEDLQTFRCLTHPGRKRTATAPEAAVDYAADMLLLLAWFKLLDDRQDEHRIRGFAGTVALKKTWRRIRRDYSRKTDAVAASLEALKDLETARCSNLDEAAEPFAQVMAEIMDAPMLARPPQESGSGIAGEDYGRSIQVAFRKIGYHLGKWIYLVDAMDDLGHDRKNGIYNPLDSWMRGIGKTEKETADRLRISLQLCLSRIAEIMDLLPLRKNLPILENIVYVGLNGKTEEMLSKFTGENPQVAGAG